MSRRRNKPRVIRALPDLNETLLPDLEAVKLIPSDDPKLLAAKQSLRQCIIAHKSAGNTALLNKADAAIQHSEEVQAKAKELRRKVNGIRP